MHASCVPCRFVPAGKPTYWNLEVLLEAYVNVPPMSSGREHVSRIRLCQIRRSAVLLRKEVIQPHLPVQLPCYDFVPVTKPDLGACLPCGLAQRLQSFSASMT